MRPLPRLLALLLVSSLTSVPCPSMAAPDTKPQAPAAAATAAEKPDYVKEIEAWQSKRVERLRGEEGWLTLVGLAWLKPGESRFGSDAGNEVVLPARTPAHAGKLVLADGKVTLVPDPGAGVLVNDEPAKEQVLGDDTVEKTDVVRVGEVRFYVIKRGEQLGVRVKDPQSPVRTGFKGLTYFPIDPAYRIEAEWVAYPTPREIDVPNVLGKVEKSAAPGVAKFKLEGQEVSLEPILEDPKSDTLFYIFKDATSGKETYGAGRFLYGPLPKDGKVLLDFNKATNPPCAFTPFATCPLPPESNRLAVAVKAGEKTYADHEH